MNIVLGIDPGMNTGFAIYRDGKLIDIHTGSPWDMAAAVKNFRPDLVVFEDSRLQSNTWSATGSRAAAMKIARNVGQVDAWCTYLVSICDMHGVPCLGISPKGKGGKLSAEEFSSITGWEGQSNEHTRDAAMVAWPKRNWRPTHA